MFCANMNSTVSKCHRVEALNKPQGAKRREEATGAEHLGPRGLGIWDTRAKNKEPPHRIAQTNHLKMLSQAKKTHSSY